MIIEKTGYSLDMVRKPLITIQITSDLKPAAITSELAKFVSEVKRLLTRKKLLQIAVTECERKK